MRQVAQVAVGSTVVNHLVKFDVACAIGGRIAGFHGRCHGQVLLLKGDDPKAGDQPDAKPVFDKILDSCQRVIACSDLSLLLVDDDSMVHIGAVRGAGGLKTAENYVPLPLQRTIVGEAVQQRRVMHYPDALHGADVPRPVQRMAGVIGNYAVVVAPMLVQDHAVGAFFIVRTFAQRPWARFTEREIALVESFAGQAAIAIQNARLFNETKEALEQQTASAEVLTVIGNSVSDAAPVFERILNSARGILNTNYVNMGLIGDDSLVHVDVNETPQFPDDPMYPKVVAWLHATYPAPVRESMHGYCAHKRAVLNYPDVQHGPGVPSGVREQTEWMGEVSLLYVPLVWKGQGIGAFEVARIPKKPFTDKEIALIKTFADQAVIAIQNAKMFRETNEALERQTATAEILKVIAGSPSDVQPVFDAIARSSNQLLGGWSTMVARIEDDALQLVAFTSTTPEGDAALRRSFPSSTLSHSLAASPPSSSSAGLRLRT